MKKFLMISLCIAHVLNAAEEAPNGWLAKEYAQANRSACFYGFLQTYKMKITN